MELLRDYYRHGSEAAFAELVRRHIHLVYSVAARHTGVAAHAEEITQAVFIILARKAAGLRPDTILEGWLHETTRLTALSFLRGERRRQFREQEAYMQSTLQESPDNAAWHQLAPLLDEAIARLGTQDRDAVMLRFFKEQSVRDVAAAMQVSEPAAQRRVLRAVDKLRQFFAEHGVDSPADAITGSIAAHSIQMAPMALAKTVTAVAIVKGAAASTSTLTIVKGALKIMAWTKAKTVITATAIVLLVTGTTTVLIRGHTKPEPKFDPKDFRDTTYPTISADAPPDFVRAVTNGYGHPRNYTFPVSPVQPCSINGLLNQCMEVSGWCYLIDPNVAAGSVQFGCHKVMNGKEWVVAFENALQSGKPEWWENKRMRRENLALIRLPKEKIVLVLPKEKAAKYQ